MACQGACTCGCCSGVSQETPQTILNRPGLPAIAYRVGAWGQFNDTLHARISLSGQPLLRNLRIRESTDFTIALFDAFSVMADVLTFYTERNANEAYLRTATEQFSVAQLAALVGYQPSPGVAASTDLAFTIDPSSGAFGPAVGGGGNTQLVPAQSQVVTIPAGTQAQSVPGTPGQLPQTFETIVPISARAAWNAIPPLLWQPQVISGDTPAAVTTLILSGAVTTLKPGDPILILVSNSDANFTSLRTVQKATVSTDAKTTQVDLDGAQTGVTGYNPQTIQPAGGSASEGQIPFVTATSLTATDPNGNDAISQILAYQWDASTLLALVQIKKWPVEQVEAAINQRVAANPAFSGGNAYVLRAQAAGFGFNVPNVMVPLASPPETFGPGNANLGNWHGNLFLDAVYSQIQPASFIVLQSDSASPKPVAAKVQTNRTVAHTDFGATLKVSLLTTDASAATLGTFSITGTSILCQSEALPLAMVPVTDIIPDNPENKITLNQAYLGIVAGQKIVLSGQRADLPGTTASEIRALQTVSLIGGFTVIELDEALEYQYVRSSVAINANVADATNGATVGVPVKETLGNGDGTQTFQSFTLKQYPLTYISADTPSGISSTLNVWVDNQQWTEVPYFYGHGPQEHIFITRQNSSGVTTVTFGDGQTGSRLPTGTANVTAVYRYGIGTPGLVDAGQISLLSTRPLGVRTVTNPLATAGAADAETLDVSRYNATLTIKTLDRIVSLEDYQDFALAFAGISKALAVWLWNGQQRMVLLTVAGVEGAIIDPETKPGSTLSQAIANASEPGVTVKLQSFTPTFFRLAGNVTVLADYIVDVISSAIETALRGAFSFDQRQFGQAVNLSEVIATIQDVQGVQDVELTALYSSSDSSPGLHQYLPAAIPTPGSRNIGPAELLTLDAAPLFPDLEVSQ
jgi:predicted phage baseplate assembly protein